MSLKIRQFIRQFLEKTSLLDYFYDIYSFYHNIRYSSSNNALVDNLTYNTLYSTERDLITKDFHAKEINQLLEPSKVLVAGCSNGNAVLAFHKIGIEAYGFDIFPIKSNDNYNLIKYLRQGDMLAIPFSENDNFDVFVCTDVFEHILMRNVPMMVNEINRLGVNWMAIIIGHGLSPGHVTLKPLKWWEKQFKGKFRYCQDIKTKTYPGIYGLDPSISRSFFTFWKRIHA